MKIAIHQPNYLPWLGFFYKMMQSDIFVLLDNVQYEKNGYTNRCQIKTSNGAQLLTLPVGTTFPQIINQVGLHNYTLTKKKHLKTIEQNYRKAPFFDFLYHDLASILTSDWEKLVDCTTQLILLLKKKMGITTRTEIASTLNNRITGAGDERLISICKFFEAETYISGSGGKRYQDQNKFIMHGIKLEYTNFRHPNYKQLWGEFIPCLSTIDLLFNYGPNSLQVLLNQ